MAYTNSRLVEWGLFLFSTLITIVTLFNVIEYSKIINGPGNDNLSDESAGYWLVVNIVLLVIAVIYWLYRVYHLIFSPKIRANINTKVSDYFVNKPYTGLVVTEAEAKTPGIGAVFTAPSTGFLGKVPDNILDNNSGGESPDGIKYRIIY